MMSPLPSSKGQSSSQLLAQFVAGLTVEQIPVDVRHRARLHLLDTLGAGIAGSRSVEVAIARKALSAGHGGAHPLTAVPLWGTPCAVSPLEAAFTNGVSAHAFELDDSGGCDHSGAVVVPAALAAAAILGRAVPVGTLLTAVVGGYEVARRVQSALGGYDAVNARGWHSTGVCGTFGAAAAAGIILGLDADTMTSALGLAGSFTGGTWAFVGDGAMSKRMHVGRAAESGLNSALLARAGFTGPTDLFAAPWGGLLRLYGGTSVDEAALTDTLGGDWQVSCSSIKPYASCRSTHSAVDALLDLIADHDLAIDDVQAVTVRTSALIGGMCGHRGLDSLVSAQLSMPFSVAAALLHGGVPLEALSTARRTDPRLLSVMDRVVIDIDENQHGGSAEPIVVVTTRTDRFERQATAARCAATNRLSDADTVAKFRTLASTRITLDAVEQIVAAILHLDAVEDVRQVASLTLSADEPTLLA